MKANRHKFYARGTNPYVAGKIEYRIYINGKPLPIGIGLTLPPALWDNKTQSMIKDKKLIKELKIAYPNIELEMRNVEIRMANIKAEVDHFIGTAISGNKEIDVNALRAAVKQNAMRAGRTIDNRPKRNKTQKNSLSNYDPSMIRDFLQSFIAEITNGTRLISSGKSKSKGNRYTEGTIKNYKTFLVKWLDFEKSKNKAFSWADMNQDLYNDFIHYLTRLNYSKKYQGRLIKEWKHLAQAAFDSQIHTNKAYSDSWFYKPNSEVKNICLTKDEIRLLEDMDLTDRPSFDKARDIFIIGCYTTLRVSDIIPLTKDNLKGDWIITQTQKTHTDVEIPLVPTVKKIIEKHNGRAPILSEQKVNQHIKLIAKEAGIDEVVFKNDDRGGSHRVVKHKKYERISMHTARRTAATLLYNAGMLPMDIMSITGHKNLATFQKYICTGDREQRQRTHDQFLKIMGSI